MIRFFVIMAAVAVCLSCASCCRTCDPTTAWRLGVQGVKLHNFHLLTGARWADEFRAGRLCVPGLDEYAALAVDFLERIPATVVIHRLAASARAERLLAPDWTADRWAGRQAVLDELERRDSWQGRALGADSDAAGRRIGGPEGGEPC